MSSYSVIISNDKDKVIIRLPINPEELEESSSQAIEKYEILKLGQIAVPTHMELKEYSFEVELPHEKSHYIEAPDIFQDAATCLKQFKTWRDDLVPVRFMAGKASGNNTVIGDAINTLVLIESLTITEKAGEEQDMYVSFKLLEYKKFTKSAKKNSEDQVNPKATEYYIVKSGDTLWAIAKKFYNDGSKYTKIYNANKGIISNPSLIYPGQKLVIPS